MGEIIGNRSCREFMSIGSGDGMMARRRFRVGLPKWCRGTCAATVLGLATILITPGGLMLASTTSTSARIAAAGNGGVRVTLNFQGKGAAGPCVDKAKRYVDCGNGTVTDSVTGLIWLKQSNCLSTASWEAAKKAAA